MVPGGEPNGGFAPFLIPSTAVHANEYLPSPVMNVPVVAATRFKRHVAVTLQADGAIGQVAGTDRRQMALSREVLGIGRVG